MLIRKDENSKSILSLLQDTIALLNGEFKILTRKLPFLLENLVGDVKTCEIPTSSIHDNLHLIQYIIQKVGGSNLTSVGR